MQRFFSKAYIQSANDALFHPLVNHYLPTLPARMKNIVAIILLLFTVSVATAQYNDIFKLTPSDQIQTSDSLFIKFLSLDTIAEAIEIKKINEAARKSGSDFGMMNIAREVMLQPLKRNPNLMIDEQAAENLLKQIEKHGFTLLAAHMNLDLGYYYCKLQKPKLAKGFPHLLQAKELFKFLPEKQHFWSMQYLQYSIAMTYYSFGDIDNARLLALESFNIKSDVIETRVFAADLLGMCYLLQNRFDSAEYYFRFVLDNVKSSPNPIAWKGIALGNLGTVYFLQHDYDKSIPLLVEGMQLTAQEDIYDNTAGFAANLCAISISRNNFIEAKSYLDTALMATHIANDLSKYYQVYKVAADYHKAVNKPHEALLYTDSANVIKDSLNIKYNAAILSKAEIALIKQQQDAFASEKEKQLLTRNFVIVGIFMAMIIVLLFFNRQRIKMQSREQQFIAEKQMTEQDLMYAQKQLDDFTNAIIEKNKLIDIASSGFTKVNTELNQLRNANTEVRLTGEEASDSLRMLHESVILTNSDWNNFSALFEKVHPGFFENLKNKYPELSPAETRFITLTKLKLSNKEMASMLGVTTDAMRQTRSRLRKKVQNDTDLGFEELVDQV